jgi:gluconolactonase
MSRWAVPIDRLRKVGQVSRAENVLGFRDGSLLCSSNLGHLTRIAADGTQSTWGSIPGGQPTSMALLDDGSVLTNNTADGLVYRIHPDGSHEVAVSTSDGRPIGAVNYVLRDSRDRIWLAVRTRDPAPGGFAVAGEGYIAVIDVLGAEPRTVADGIRFPNEIKLSADERHAFVPETLGRRVLRYDVTDDGLADPEVFGPHDLGPGGYPDGVTPDSEGNLWVAQPNRNGVLVITAEGETATVFEEPVPDAIEAFDREWESGFITFPALMATAGSEIVMPTSIAFAGPQLGTAYVGSLRMPHLLSFDPPTTGIPMTHQREVPA